MHFLQLKSSNRSQRFYKGETQENEGVNGKLQESASEQRRATRNAKTTTTGYRHDAEGAETRGIAWWCYYIPPSLMLYLWPTVVVVGSQRGRDRRLDFVRDGERACL